jgi:hypothetical protein
MSKKDDKQAKEVAALEKLRSENLALRQSHRDLRDRVSEMEETLKELQENADSVEHVERKTKKIRRDMDAWITRYTKLSDAVRSRWYRGDGLFSNVVIEALAACEAHFLDLSSGTKLHKAIETTKLAQASISQGHTGFLTTSFGTLPGKMGDLEQYREEYLRDVLHALKGGGAFGTMVMGSGYSPQALSMGIHLLLVGGFIEEHGEGYRLTLQGEKYLRGKIVVTEEEE